MDYLLVPQLLPTAFISMAMIGCSLALLRWGPRRGASLWLAVYLLLWSVGFVANALRNLTVAEAQRSIGSAEVAKLSAQAQDLDRLLGATLPSSAFLVVMAALVSGTAPRWLAPGAVGAYLAMLAAMVFGAPHWLVTWQVRDGLVMGDHGPLWIVAGVLPFTIHGLALVMLLARPAGRAGSRERRSQYLLGLGMMVYPVHRFCAAWADGLNDPSATFGNPGAGLVTNLAEVISLGLIGAAVTWTCIRLLRWNEERLGVVIALVLGIATGVMRIHVAAVPNFLYFGLAYVGLPVLATYAMLRHSLFGIDVRVRWTLSRTTVAATFVAAFFVVSELSAEYFSRGLGSTTAGIVAAGMLIFAIAPLQRLADRIAGAAVPVNEEAGDVRDTYRRQVEIAWTDGVLGWNERLMLDELAMTLGLPAVDVRRIETEIAARIMGQRTEDR